MSTNGGTKQPVFVVVQLSGGNDFMNTVIPYTSPVYYDNRPLVGIPQEQVIPFTDTLAFHPMMSPIKDLYDSGNVAIVQGIGYPDQSRSHFRGMDIWHTCQPEKLSSTGWLGRTIRELDPRGENSLTGVNFGVGLPRAMAMSGVPVTSISDLDNYGLMSDVEAGEQREEVLEAFKDMYGPAIGTGPVMEYLGQTGNDVLSGADIIKVAPERYESSIEYADNPISKSLRDVARVHTADVGVRVFYTAHGGYDVHANENPTQPKLIGDLSAAISDFFADLREHEASDNLVMMVFTEFGRRIRDNGSGTDHGSGGGAFLIGDPVAGGLYAEYPSLDRKRWAHGEDLEHTIDYRGIYGTVLEQWLSVEAAPIVGGQYEQINPFR